MTGRGAAKAAPDTATVRVAVGHRAASVQEACAAVASGVTEVGAVARRCTDASAIASSDFGVWPATDDKGRPAGFEARHALTVRVPDIETAGSLIDGLAENVGGRLRIDGVELGVADVSGAQTAAREAAFDDARTRAGHLASLAGAGLGELVTVHEGSGAPGPGPRVLAVAAAAKTSFEPGEQSIDASLTVTWQLVPLG